jgi:hypothetical protein
MVFNKPQPYSTKQATFVQSWNKTTCFRHSWMHGSKNHDLKESHAVLSAVTMILIYSQNVTHNYITCLAKMVYLLRKRNKNDFPLQLSSPLYTKTA